MGKAVKGKDATLTFRAHRPDRAYPGDLVFNYSNPIKAELTTEVPLPKENSIVEIHYDKYGCVYHTEIRKAKSKNKEYHFKGELRLAQVISDCLEDNVKTFVIIEKERTTLGIVKQLSLVAVDELLEDNIDELIYNPESIIPYHMLRFKKEETYKAVRMAKKYAKLIRKRERKIKRNINKRKANGEFSSEPKTTVKVF